ncbi:lipoprotein-associated protein [Mycoplasma testudineum]|uniref:Lipoprotein-associated protein n=1 Tax=Mycoplasma testudineum TaxID=244584 RepID=A0A4R6IFU2_9MOLU|nr:lipoprotein 17-related variable surface protein [Mycoplasma testudineum]OYD27020.1 hypothetical protein CG473_01645 [Mycoplasma testudineum]TDO20568.1 lipoprotein-associated protein [Mycoplasma testudineum]
MNKTGLIIGSVVGGLTIVGGSTAAGIIVATQRNGSGSEDPGQAVVFDLAAAVTTIKRDAKVNNELKQKLASDSFNLSLNSREISTLLNLDSVDIKEFRAEYKMTLVDDANGQIEVDIKVSKGAESSEFKMQFFGFLVKTENPEQSKLISISAEIINAIKSVSIDKSLTATEFATAINTLEKLEAFTKIGFAEFDANVANYFVTVNGRTSAELTFEIASKVDPEIKYKFTTEVTDFALISYIDALKDQFTRLSQTTYKINSDILVDNFVKLQNTGSIDEQKQYLINSLGSEEFFPYLNHFQNLKLTSIVASKVNDKSALVKITLAYENTTIEASVNIVNFITAEELAKKIHDEKMSTDSEYAAYFNVLDYFQNNIIVLNGKLTAEEYYNEFEKLSQGQINYVGDEKKINFGLYILSQEQQNMFKSEEIANISLSLEDGKLFIRFSIISDLARYSTSLKKELKLGQEAPLPPEKIKQSDILKSINELEKKISTDTLKLSQDSLSKYTLVDFITAVEKLDSLTSFEIKNYLDATSKSLLSEFEKLNVSSKIIFDFKNSTEDFKFEIVLSWDKHVKSYKFNINGFKQATKEEVEDKSKLVYEQWTEKAKSIINSNIKFKDEIIAPLFYEEFIKKSIEDKKQNLIDSLIDKNVADFIKDKEIELLPSVSFISLTDQFSLNLKFKKHHQYNNLTTEFDMSFIFNFSTTTEYNYYFSLVTNLSKKVFYVSNGYKQSEIILELLALQNLSNSFNLVEYLSYQIDENQRDDFLKLNNGPFDKFSFSPVKNDSSSILLTSKILLGTSKTNFSIKLTGFKVV